MVKRETMKDLPTNLPSQSGPYCPTCKRYIPTGVCSKKGCKREAGR